MGTIDRQSMLGFTCALLAAALSSAGTTGCVEESDPTFTPVPVTMNDPGIDPGRGYGPRRDAGGADRDDGLRDEGPRPDGDVPDRRDRGLGDINPDLPDIADLPDVGGMTRVDAGPAEPDTCSNDGDCTLAVQLDTCDPCPIAAPLDDLAADRCLVRYIAGATLGAYAPADCWADCGEAAGDACLAGPAAAICDPPRGPGRSCVIFR